jgi:hypothetical protein
MRARSKYAAIGLSAEDIADLEACDAAHEAWWAKERRLGWTAGNDPWALRGAFNAGWYRARRYPAPWVQDTAKATPTRSAKTENTGLVRRMVARCLKGVRPNTITDTPQ